MGWLVTLATLAVFLSVVIPEQKREFELNLESKARGIVASIKGVAASAAVTEDYSVLVDQAMQVLLSDKAIDFVIITRNDGFSVVVDQSSWSAKNLDGFWRPADRRAAAAIGTVPLFGRRVFHYATPFDYSGVQWGWIHIGLMLDAYDQSVRRTYTRTGALALLCVGMSLVIALFYAKRLVRPIHTLHNAVERVTRGDLHARADVRSRDEIERLADAFNSMTAAILTRNQTLDSVALAAQELLSATEWTAVIQDVLESFGRALAASRAHVFENSTRDGRPTCCLLYEWRTAGAPSARDQWQTLCWEAPDLEKWGARLRSGQPVLVRAAEMKDEESALAGPGVKSLIAFPIFVAEEWWGFLSLEDCVREREWGDAEKDGLGTLARMFGASIVRQRARDELIEAKATLESRVAERTRELQEEVTARVQAHAELAATQERLIALSRQAGMAEVATGVLHNVGNVLNSVNVAAGIVVDKLRHSRVDKLAPVVELLDEHQNDLSVYLTRDPRGTRVLPYLNKLTGHLVQERDSMISELAQLSRHVGHIKEIVAAQQGYATTAGFVEVTSIEKLVEDALAISKDGLERGDVAVFRHYDKLPEITTDRHKVLQIVLNLLRNARDATMASGKDRKEIHIHLRLAAPDRFQIVVADNGIGLDTEGLSRIFQHGFTTKSKGHGFGLHSGALAARELSGQLTAASDGPGKGASFALELPLQLVRGQEELVRR